MKINPTNNLSFKALVVDNENQTKTQKKIINAVLKNSYLTNELINNLEEMDTDIIITANTDGRSVDLKLETDAFLGIKYIPFDEKGKPLKKTLAAETAQNNYNMFLASSVFFKRAQNLDLSTDKNTEAVSKIFDI